MMGAHATQRNSSFATRVLAVLVCGSCTLGVVQACSDDKPAPTPVVSAPPAPVADRIAQAAAPKLDQGPSYGVEEWPRFAQALAEGQGRELTESVCSACHSTAYIIGQPPLDEAGWKGEVHKMIDAYGASVPEGGAEKITAYLVAQYGPSRAKLRTSDGGAVAAKGTQPSDPASSPQAGDPLGPYPRGERIYMRNCVACHQATGMGVPSAFPPLAGHVPELLDTAKGRGYLPQVVLYGLYGEIKVKGAAYNNVMTPFPQLEDKDLAAVLNHVSTAWGNAQLLKDFKPFTAEDIAAQRKRGGSSKDTYAARP